VLARLQQAVSQPIALGTGSSVAVTMSIGLALYPQHASSARVLLELADQAMYQSKHKGGHQVTLYNPGLGQAPGLGS